MNCEGVRVTTISFMWQPPVNPMTARAGQSGYRAARLLFSWPHRYFNVTLATLVKGLGEFKCLCHQSWIFASQSEGQREEFICIYSLILLHSCNFWWLFRVWMYVSRQLSNWFYHWDPQSINLSIHLLLKEGNPLVKHYIWVILNVKHI